MTIALLREVFGWCTLINLSLLYVWFFWIMFARDWTYRLHHRWFNLSSEQFDSIHYVGMAVFKIGIILFNLTPYLALLIVDW
jgi:hypothetical protein